MTNDDPTVCFRKASRLISKRCFSISKRKLAAWYEYPREAARKSSDMMRFEFSRRNLSGQAKALERFFEILPGFVSWAILLGMLLISFWDPIFAAVLVIAFDFYWLLRLFYMTLFLVLAYLRLSIEQRTDWMSRVHGIDHLGQYLNDFDHLNVQADLKKKISLWIHRKELETLKQSNALLPSSKEIYHLVLFSIAKELKEIVEPGIKSLAHQIFPPNQILVILAIEERADPSIKEGIKVLHDKYRNSFFDLLVTIHPDGVPGEARVKGANVTYAAKTAARYFEEKKIPFENVIVSCFDADTVVSHDYFSSLTYHFMACPARNRASFQPIPVYNNNIWEASAFARVLDVGSSFFQLIEATNPDKLVTFSSHSMSFKALVEIGYWPVDIISDDSAIFWKALIHFDGDYRVIPMYVTLSMDIVSGSSWWKTIVNVYRQKRRWAWGVENFPIVMRAFLANKKISLYDKMRYGFKLFEDHVAWATWAFLLTFVGWLPVLFAGQKFSNSVLYYSTPRITGIIFNLASIALVATVVLSLCLLPKKHVRNPLLKRIGFALEWLLVPAIVVFLSAMPALDAQTRLMFGAYMEFWVTEKKRGL